MWKLTPGATCLREMSLFDAGYAGPGWNAEIEGKIHNCLGAQNSMRRLILPHIVFFHFESLSQLSPSFRTFEWRKSSVKPRERDLALEYGAL